MLRISILLVLLLAPQVLVHAYYRNNVCNTFEDYAILEKSKNCFFSPDEHLNQQQTIQKYAGVFETYEATSADGYITSIFRIPRGNPKGVVLLKHPLISDSACFIYGGNKSIALTMWNNGYDVWLPNERGTEHSEGHVNLTVADYEYWNFSFHEMAVLDLPAQIELIRRHTNGSRLIFIGHSLATTIGLIYSSLFPKEAEGHFKVFVHMAPTCYYVHNTSPSILLKLLWRPVEVITKRFRLGPVVPPAAMSLLKFLVRTIFATFPFTTETLATQYFAAAGWTGEPDPTFFGAEFLKLFKNFAWKSTFHLSQLMESVHRLQMYDYGPAKNHKIYGSQRPPRYPIENITVPTVLVYSPDDHLVRKEDVEILYSELPTKAKIYGRIVIQGVNHYDYNFGRHRGLIFDKILKKLGGI